MIMKIKYDHKVIMALEDGLKDGCLNYVVGLKPNDNYHTQKESKAYHHGRNASSFGAYEYVWQQTGERYALMERAIKIKDIVPIGWCISRCIDSDFKPFIEETTIS